MGIAFPQAMLFVLGYTNLNFKMEFASFTFIFLFLPVAITGFLVLPVRFRAFFLFLSSCLFYFWNEPLFILVLLLYILFNYTMASLIAKSNPFPALAKSLQIFTILVDLGIFFFFKTPTKYLRAIGFPAQLLLWNKNFLFPTGISFISFTSLSFLFDLSSGKIDSAVNPLEFANYILFFPKILQGPIERFENFKNGFSCKLSIKNFSKGVSRFIQGLAKKVLIADNLAPVAQSVFTSNLSEVGFSLSWYAIIAFGLQIYFDFSGYTDMAIGIASLFGYELPENFNAPYAAKSIADFWRRWHMTLTAWFRDYIFIPLEIKFRKLGMIRQPLNLLVVFTLTGLWHGFDLHFLVWGAYFGLILALESLWLNRWLKRLPEFFQHLYALLFIMIGWIFFRLNSPQNWLLFLKSLFGWNGFTAGITARTLNLLGYLPVLAVATILCIPFPGLQKLGKSSFVQWLNVFVHLLLFLLTISFLVEGGFQAFIYKQF